MHLDDFLGQGGILVGTLRETGAVGVVGGTGDLQQGAGTRDRACAAGVLRLLAETLALPRTALTLVSGHGGREKIVELTGMGPALIERRLASAAGDARGRKERR